MIDLIAVARANSASGHRAIKMVHPPIEECVRLGMREGRAIDNYDESLAFYIGTKVKCGLSAGDMVKCYYDHPNILIFKSKAGQTRGYTLADGGAGDPRCLYLIVPYIPGQTPVRFSYRKEVAVATGLEDGILIRMFHHHIVPKPEQLDVVRDRYTLGDRIKSWMVRRPWPS
ncbi:MAG: hypothetical protein ABIL58_23370 [Pseudomonadota bacterium]